MLEGEKERECISFGFASGKGVGGLAGVQMRQKRLTVYKIQNCREPD